MVDRSLISAAESKLPEMLDTLRQLVEHESPSSDKSHVDLLIDYLQDQLLQRGANIQRIAQDEFGDLLVARWGGDRREPLLVMTHVDTVWPVGTIEHIPWRVADGVARGPGVYDMKASVAMMLAALDLVSTLDGQRRPITWLINTEEEVGSPVSRQHIEELARESAYVLCLEPPVPPDDALKTERKGVGMFTMTVSGRAAHAGADHESGISAIEELARQIQWLHGLTDYERGTTLNVGVISGGTKRNVVAAEASALIDLRVTTVAEADRLVPIITGASSMLEGTQVSVDGELNRPPMERSAHVLEAFGRAREIGASIGVDVKESSTGGGSDGNFTAAIGVPTIDGLGCPGDGAHANHEHIQVAKLITRSALIAALLAEL